MLKLIVSLGLLVLGATAGLPGGRSPADVNSPDVQLMAQFAVSSLNTQSLRASLPDMSMAKIVKAERQVVAGTNYYLEIQIKESGCTANCRVEMCKVTVFDQAWTKTRQLTQFSCQATSSKREVLVGGQHSISTGDVAVQKAAQFAVSAINSMTNSMFASSLVKVESATSQVVAGVKYNLEIVIGQTTCRNQQPVDLSRCSMDTNSKPKRCTLSVLQQAWMKPEYTLLNGFRCV